MKFGSSFSINVETSARKFIMIHSNLAFLSHIV